MRPNLIYIVADDLGAADLGCYGGRSAVFGPVSPNIDALAANGLKLTDGYSNSPVCSPTRIALMTMRYQYRERAGLDEPLNTAATGLLPGLPVNRPTLPSLLRETGYTTALVGKWHLGNPPAYGPLRSGYDEFFGVHAGAVDYFTHRSVKGDHDLYQGESRHPREGYLTDLLSVDAVNYVKSRAAAARQGKPFFLSLHYTAPHWPWETRDDDHIPAEIGNSLAHVTGGNIDTYRRMIHHMDEGIGWLVDALRAEGLMENTLLVFTSDNGGERFSDNWPFVGGKMDLTEGGIRVPWIAHWPGVIPKDTASAQHCMTMDWSATLLELGGGVPHPDYPLDGISLAAVLRDPKHVLDRPLFWRMNFRQQRAMRQGDWKYLKVDANEYLFNLAQDGRERANCGKKHPERLAAMRQAWLDWERTMPAIPDDAKVTTAYSVKDMPQS